MNGFSRFLICFDCVRLFATLALTAFIVLDHTKARAADDDVVIDVKSAIQKDEQSNPREVAIDNINPIDAGENVPVAGRRAGLVVKLQTFERAIFGINATGERGFWQIDDERETKINEIDQICQLTEVQRQKLDLAAQGDCKRFYNHVDAARQNYYETSGRGRQFEIHEIRTSVDKGILGPSSMFAKTIQNTLTKEQLATLEYPQWLLYVEGVEKVLELIDTQVQLRAAQRNDLKDLIRLELPRSRVFQDAQILNQEDFTNDFLYRFASLDASKLKSVLVNKQWDKLETELNSYRNLKAHLVEVGLIVPDSDVMTIFRDRDATGELK